MSSCSSCGKETCVCPPRQKGYIVPCLDLGRTSKDGKPLHTYERVDLIVWKYVVLESIETGRRFWSPNTNKFESDWYKLIGLANTVYDAQALCDIPRHAREPKEA